MLRAVLRDPAIAGVIYATIFTRKVERPARTGEHSDDPAELLCRAAPHLGDRYPERVAGGFAATAHLTSLGHRRIGFINGEPWMDAAIDPAQRL